MANGIISQLASLDFKKLYRLLNVLLHSDTAANINTALTTESQVGYDNTNKRIVYRDDVGVQYLLATPDIASDFTNINKIPNVQSIINNAVTFGRGVRLGYRLISSNTNVTINDFHIDADATSGNISINLLPSNSFITGQIFNFQKIDATANTVIITAAGSDLIGGSTTRILNTANANVRILATGAGRWRII